jgi:hypothetical protein
MKWNSIKVSYPGMNLTPQADMIFDRLQILSFASRKKWLSPKYSLITFSSNSSVYLHVKKNLKNMTLEISLEKLKMFKHLTTI